VVAASVSIIDVPAPVAKLAKLPTAQVPSQRIAYTAALRLGTAGDGPYSATYSYLANSPLVSQIVFKQGANTRMTTSRQYDKRNRLLSISSATNSAPAPLSASAYQYNSADRRVFGVRSKDSRNGLHRRTAAAILRA
jgi:hypothetical protein